jgi:hypothetical protein
MIENRLQAVLAGNPSRIHQGLGLVARKFRVSITPWLGDDRSTIQWDPYRHGPKERDLIFFDTAKARLILCELKALASQGENALLQLIDYLHALQFDHDAQKRLNAILARRRPTVTRTIPDLLADSALYIIIAGHVSQLLKKRVSYLVDDLARRVAIFQALPGECLPPDGWAGVLPDDWQCVRVFPV